MRTRSPIPGGLLATLVTAGLATLAACPHGGSTPAGGGPVAAADSLAASLTAELGAPVAILPSAQGLIAVSADGARREVLAPPPVSWALVDDRAQVIWFGNAGTIWLLDTTVAAPTPEQIVTGLPDEVISGEPGVSIYYPGDDTLSIGHPAYYRIVIAMGDEPVLEGDSGAWTDDEEFGPAVAAVPLSAEVKARLAALWKRGAGRAIALPSPAEITERVAVDPEAPCEDEDMCGQASAIPGTSLWRVVMSYSCGDGCYIEYGIYDPASHAFVADDPWQDRVQQAWVSPDGHALISGGALVRRDGAGVVVDGDGAGGGWLGGGYYISF
ncbi:MAG: hypothetical protein H6709_20390 [Kofleriaceae bacterium]|nr:hypothetical protein [Kofleriaceae bacterium]MCB9574441.1 hypothetical protein [Kofleriaceae bacterium]